MKKYLIWSLLIIGLTTGCSSDDDVNTGPEPGVSNLDTQNFMWKTMNLWYFWQADVPNLGDNKFSTDEEYTAFLSSPSDPADFFDDKLRFTEDRFSFYEENYKDLVNSLSGVAKHNGVEYGLIQITGTNDIFGYVQYILPDSDASSKDIKRGDIFVSVDGQSLTTSNYIDLLFGSNDSYTLGFSDYIDKNPAPNGKSVALTKTAYTENPVFFN